MRKWKKLKEKVIGEKERYASSSPPCTLNPMK